MKRWLIGLVNAVISSAAMVVTVMITDPEKFNLSTGLLALGTVIVVSAGVSMAKYIISNPIPLDTPQAVINVRQDLVDTQQKGIDKDQKETDKLVER